MIFSPYKSKGKYIRGYSLEYSLEYVDKIKFAAFVIN